MRSPHLTFVLLLPLVVLAVGRVHAQGTKVGSGEAKAVVSTEWNTGVASFSLSLEGGALDPSRYDPEAWPAVGFGVELVGRPQKLPIMFGLGAGWLIFPEDVSRGVESPYTIDLVHAALLARYEPFWGPVRPWLQGGFGFGVLRHSYGDEELNEPRSGSYLAVAAAGIDFALSKVHDPEGAPPSTRNTVLSLGMRRLFSGNMERPLYGIAESELEAAADHLKMWSVFLAVAFAFDTRLHIHHGTPSVKPD